MSMTYEERDEIRRQYRKDLGILQEENDNLRLEIERLKERNAEIENEIEDYISRMQEYEQIVGCIEKRKEKRG